MAPMHLYGIWLSLSSFSDIMSASVSMAVYKLPERDFSEIDRVCKVKMAKGMCPLLGKWWPQPVLFFQEGSASQGRHFPREE
jgi:hypothetical protein